MYEVELKVEITAQEKEALTASFEGRGLKFEGTTPQDDFIIEGVKSPHGGYDLKRYRHEGDKYFYTEKTWEMLNENFARKEEEREVSKEAFEAEISKFPSAIKIKKQREWYCGTNEGTYFTLTIDNVKFDHSPEMRYFVEAEVKVDDFNEVKSMREKIAALLADLLGKPEGIQESAGMFSMAFNKK